MQLHPFVSSDVEKHATNAGQGVSTSLDTNGKSGSRVEPSHSG